MICASVVESDLQRTLETSMDAVSKGAHMVEIRFDLMESIPSDLSPFASMGVPVIATLRSEGQGGGFKRGPEEQGLFLEEASRHFDIVDVELGIDPVPDTGEARIISSHHRFRGGSTCSQILGIMDRASHSGDVSKGAFMIDSVTDLHELVKASRVLRQREGEHILIGMGELGTITRIRSERLGNAFTFASMGRGRETAPGQLDLKELKGLSEGVVTGITGFPLSHSMSPPMHRAAFEHLGVKGTYLRFPTAPGELPKLMDMIGDLDIRGMNVTIPHKEEVIPLLDHVDPVTGRIGAVNTIVNENGRLRGMNTDIDGVAGTFSAASVSPSGKRALVLGAGGAARACCSFLVDGGARIHVINRSRERALGLRKDFPEVEIVNIAEALTIDPEVIVNCTPLGMKGFPDSLPVDPEIFGEGQFVMDTVYNPPVTRLMVEAQRRGARVRSGIEMLIYQAISAFQVWTGLSPPYEAMARALKEELG